MTDGMANPSYIPDSSISGSPSDTSITDPSEARNGPEFKGWQPKVPTSSSEEEPILSVIISPEKAVTVNKIGFPHSNVKKVTILFYTELPTSNQPSVPDTTMENMPVEDGAVKFPETQARLIDVVLEEPTIKDGNVPSNYNIKLEIHACFESTGMGYLFIRFHFK